MSGNNHSWLSTSILKKFIMAVTGLMLSAFLAGHLIGNTLMYISAELFNQYGHALISNPLIYVVEGVMLLIFVTHIFFALKLILENWLARPEKYVMKKTTGRGATIMSSTMLYTGPIILVFIITHLINFKYGTVYEATYDGEAIRDLHVLMINFYSNPPNLVMYIFFVLIIAVHVSHGVWSAFQTFGFDHPRYNKCLIVMSKLFGVFVFIAYSAFPIWAFLQN